MTATTVFDRHLQQIAAGERLEPETIRTLAQAADILPLGMLGDALRRRLRGSTTTYLRVAVCPFDGSFADAVPVAAREIRIGGHPPSIDVALSAVHAARAIAGDRTVSGFSWGDVAGFAQSGSAPLRVLRSLREAGLDALAELPLDAMDDCEQVLGQMQQAGFDQIRVTVEKMPAAARLDALLRLNDVQQKVGGIVSVNPLPLSLNTFRPTTGYEDVKMVAVARLAACDIPHIQVDWQRYGPKLAQVALTFGADDIDGVSADDAAPEGRRRAPLEEIRRNIHAAGFEPIERDGRFVVIG